MLDTPTTPTSERIQKALESSESEDRKIVSGNALERQLNNNPVTPRKRKFEIAARIRGDYLAAIVVAADESEAWAIFCDEKKLPESLRSRRFARPQIVDRGEAPLPPNQPAPSGVVTLAD